MTTTQADKSAPGLYSFVYGLWGSTGADPFYLGALWSGSSDSSDVGWGQWTWIDGTNASNLNCYTQGCNLWFR